MIEETNHIDMESFASVKKTELAAPPEMEQKAELRSEDVERLLKEILPPKDFGVLYEAVGATTQFQDELKQALVEGRADEFLQEQAAHLETVYPVLDQSENANSLALNHRPENLAKVNEQLSQLRAEVETSTQISDLNKEFYLSTVNEFLAYCQEIVPSIGKPEFSLVQPENWSNIIDMDTSRAEAKIVFPQNYLEEAARVLQSSSESEKNPQDLQTIMQETYNFSPAEKDRLGVEFFAAQELSAPQFLQLMEVLCARLGIAGWEQVLKNGSTVSINEPSKQICAGEKLKMEADRVGLSPVHEMLHLICAEHGARLQNFPLQKGVEGYLDTQEGITMVLEMALGKKFDDPKSKTTAANYLVRALLSEVKQDEDGQWQAAHSTQEIFEQMRGFGMSETAVSASIYRALRGTSLKREVVEVQIDDASPPLKMAETYLKDMVYWRGQQQMYEYLLDQIDFVDPARKQKLTERGYDFNDRLLRRIGYEAAKQQPDQHLSMTGEQRAEVAAKLKTLGQETLLGLIDKLTTGRAPLATLLRPEMRELTEELQQNGQFLSIKDVLKPGVNLTN